MARTLVAKNYQRRVLTALSDYLDLLDDREPDEAYDAIRERNGLPSEKWNDRGCGAPAVCAKVPTAGGKTFIATASVFKVFRHFASDTRVVVWLVPSDAIRKQTLKALKDPNHPYRRQLDMDFMRHVQVLDFDEALNGVSFTTASVRNNLTVLVMTYDSIRAGSTEGRRAYRANTVAAAFEEEFPPDREGFGQASLIGALSGMHPYVVVDESHHSGSELSVQMLRNLSPCFVFELTATPRPFSNVICNVSSIELKREHMVKLPVLLVNRKRKENVIADACKLRKRLEEIAQGEERMGKGGYVRPIALFQAEARASHDTSTYERIREALIGLAVPEEEIAIKTADRDELGTKDLMSPDCPVRYIITVNALAEGWDCPFAYVLANVANRTSPVSVEQIIGRIMRLPYAKESARAELNTSYVLTSSADFDQAARNVVEGLVSAGYNETDLHRVEERKPKENTEGYQAQPFDLEFDSQEKTTGIESDQEDEMPSSEGVRAAMAEGGIDDLINQSVEVQSAMAKPVIPPQVGIETPVAAAPEKGKARLACEYGIKFDVSKLLLPQYYWNDACENPALIGRLVEKDDFWCDFDFGQIGFPDDFARSGLDAYTIDVDPDTSDVKKSRTYNRQVVEYLHLYRDLKDPAVARQTAREMLQKLILDRETSLQQRSLYNYLGLLLDRLTEDQIDDILSFPGAAAQKIKEYIVAKRNENALRKMESIHRNQMTCMGSYAFPSTIRPDGPDASLRHTLYEVEDLGGLHPNEMKCAQILSDSPDIVWWHRINERKRNGEFYINGCLGRHYPDFVAMDHRDRIHMIELKGAQLLGNNDTTYKMRLGEWWANDANADRSDTQYEYRYEMVFETTPPERAITFDQLESQFR